MQRHPDSAQGRSDDAPREPRLTRRAALAVGIVYGAGLADACASCAGGIHRGRHHRGRLLPVEQTGVSTWVTIDTSGLAAPKAPRLLINGEDAATAFGYPQPTGQNPMVKLLVPVGRHTFEWGPYAATLEVKWRGYPFTGRTDFYSQLNNEYFGGPWSNVARAGGVDNSAAYQNWAAINNGYSVVPDPAPATSCVFALAPGDEPYGPGRSNTLDTRAELNMTDDYALFDAAVPGSPPGGLDVFGNRSRSVRFWRLDFMFPSEWTAPVPVQNTQGKWAVPPFGSGRGRWQLPPAAQGGPQPSRVITNSLATMRTLNNILETGGPGIVVASMCNGANDFCWLYSPSALGRDLRTLRIDVRPLRFNRRENTILEYRPEPYCTGRSGRKIYDYGVPPGGRPYGGGYLRTWRLIDGEWRCTSAGNPFAVSGVPRIVDGRIVGDRDAGKIFGPTMRTHPDGRLVGGLVASPGLNAQRSLPSPMCVREWPLLIGPTFASVSSPPAA